MRLGVNHASREEALLDNLAAMSSIPGSLATKSISAFNFLPEYLLGPVRPSLVTWKTRETLSFRIVLSPISVGIFYICSVI
jgi:hypothetical protein